MSSTEGHWTADGLHSTQSGPAGSADHEAEAAKAAAEAMKVAHKSMRDLDWEELARAARPHLTAAPPSLLSTDEMEPLYREWVDSEAHMYEGDEYGHERAASLVSPLAALTSAPRRRDDQAPQAPLVPAAHPGAPLGRAG